MLDLADGVFDLVLCQQGLQFFPERYGGARGAKGTHIGLRGGHAVVLGGCRDDLLSEAGFRRVEITSRTIDVRFPSPDRFVDLTVLAGAAVVPTFDYEDAAARLALAEAGAREIEPVLQHYRSGDKLVMPTSWLIAVACSS